MCEKVDTACETNAGDIAAQLGDDARDEGTRRLVAMLADSRGTVRDNAMLLLGKLDPHEQLTAHATGHWWRPAGHFRFLGQRR